MFADVQSALMSAPTKVPEIVIRRTIAVSLLRSVFSSLSFRLPSPQYLPERSCFPANPR